MAEQPAVRATICQAIIKCRLSEFAEPVYLVQYDEKAGHYQLIGGHQEAYDDNKRATIIREIDEELSLSADDYQITEIARDITARGWSLTDDVYKEYSFTIFHVLLKKKDFRPGSADKWLTLSQLRQQIAENTRKKQGDVNYLEILDQRLPGGLANLAAAEL